MDGKAVRGGTRGAGMSPEGGHMSDHSEEVYGPDRAERLLAMLRALAERIQTLDRTGGLRSEEHTSELQSRLHLVCRLLLEKKKKIAVYMLMGYTLLLVST